MFYFSFLLQSGAARQQQKKNETSSKTKIMKYVQITLKDCLKTADVRKFRVNAALLHFEVNPIAPVYYRGLQTERSHSNVLEAAAAPSGLSPAWNFPMAGFKISKFIFVERGIRGRRRRRMVLAIISGCGCVVGFNAGQKRKVDNSPVTRTVLHFG